MRYRLQTDWETTNFERTKYAVVAVQGNYYYLCEDLLDTRARERLLPPPASVCLPASCHTAAAENLEPILVRGRGRLVSSSARTADDVAAENKCYALVTYLLPSLWWRRRRTNIHSSE